MMPGDLRVSMYQQLLATDPVALTWGPCLQKDELVLVIAAVHVESNHMDWMLVLGSSSLGWMLPQNLRRTR